MKMERENRIKCDICGETFSSKKGLNIHNKIVHGISEEEEKELEEGTDKTLKHG
ncbi:MAG: hypothetical protein QG670_1911 [Thermoproteota archaeon]|nr:hypothetical protein [Thermoproteota archaeon]